MKSFLVKFFATGFGLGYCPILPGTLGSLLGLAFFYFLGERPLIFRFVIFLVLAVWAIFFADQAEKVYGEKDCQKIVIDEIAGQFLAYLFLIGPLNWPALLIGFVLFRIFDTTKVLGSRWVQDNIIGGLGVVGDDLVAGLYAGILLFVAEKFLL